MRRWFFRLARAVGLFVLAACFLWFLPLFVWFLLSDPQRFIAMFARKTKQPNFYEIFKQWQKKESRDRFKRIAKIRDNFYK